MSMPQVHIVAYCGDLGYGVARGAEMLSVMLGFGIISRIGSGFIADRIGGLATMLLGSALQALALLLYLWFDGLTSLYVISALFGLVQGGIIPMYAVIVRDFFPPQEAGTRVGLAVMATIVGMAFGRLAVRGNFRPDGLVRPGLQQWHCLEPAQCLHRRLFDAATGGTPANRAPEAT